MNVLAKTIEMIADLPERLALHVAKVYVCNGIAFADEEGFVIRHNQHLRKDFILYALKWGRPLQED